LGSVLNANDPHCPVEDFKKVSIIDPITKFYDFENGKFSIQENTEQWDPYRVVFSNSGSNPNQSEPYKLAFSPKSFLEFFAYTETGKPIFYEDNGELWIRSNNIPCIGYYTADPEKLNDDRFNLIPDVLYRARFMVKADDNPTSVPSFRMRLNTFDTDTKTSDEANILRVDSYGDSAICPQIWGKNYSMFFTPTKFRRVGSDSKCKV